jgi:hypothetical protein
MPSRIAKRKPKAYIPLETGTGADHTREILKELRGSGDLATLKRIATRSLDSPYPDVRQEGRRSLAFVYARSSVPAEREAAVDLKRMTSRSSSSC